ncbi:MULTISPECIES: hypothetical protein [unclassified Pseudomonas]|uniref:hypothetical protein n=1 Tax=unclassified Pseudomonas TaxID=196821 RepID=UPI002113B55A
MPEGKGQERSLGAQRSPSIDLRAGRKGWEEITNGDFHFDIDQKAVDIKLGMDITTLALNKLADVIVLGVPLTN